MKNLLFLLLIFALSGAACRKPHHEEGFYFQCKINGKEYIPNGCANCRVAKLLGDTTLLINGNRGFETILIGIIKMDRMPIIETYYVLNGNPSQGATCKYSTTVNDRYDTDSLRTGMLIISTLDKTNNIIAGTFYFKAYNAYRNDSIMVTDGIFRLKYNNN